ncbi:hypothetical protein AGMMS50267_02640 [Spirochaetia bacterium]|nr:hypothetical protein AGMMS50267_02640 [Spirochaetia bacterium]
MKRTGLIWLLLAGIMAAGVFVGCKSNPEPVEPEEIVPEVTPPEIPLVPITQEIIERVIKNGKDIKSFQYYISASITLEKEKQAELVKINNRGEGMLQKTFIRIQIEEGTKGVLKNNSGVVTGYGLEICFDEDDKKTLLFRKNSKGTQFDLVHTAGAESIVYGGERYQVRMGENNPHLLIRYKEEINSQPAVQRVMGRSISPVKE